MEADSLDSASSSPSRSDAKVCRVCGKDLAGHRRIKDSLGYICVACAKEAEKKEQEGTVKCGECGRRLKPSGLVPWRNKMICRSCLKDHEELNRFKTPPPSAAGHKEHQKKQLFILLGIAGVLALIMLLSRAGVIGGGDKPTELSPAEVAAQKEKQKQAQPPQPPQATEQPSTQAK